MSTPKFISIPLNEYLALQRLVGFAASVPEERYITHFRDGPHDEERWHYAVPAPWRRTLLQCVAAADKYRPADDEPAAYLGRRIAPLRNDQIDQLHAYLVNRGFSGITPEDVALLSGRSDAAMAERVAWFDDVEARVVGHSLSEYYDEAD